MKRVLGALLVVSVLVIQSACGGDTDDTADDPATQSETTAGDPRVVEILSASAVGGHEAEAATVISDDRALRSYLRQFRATPFTAELTEAVRAHRPAPDRVIGLAVIEVSCDEPPSATVTEEDGRFLVTAGKVVDPHLECYVPVTSVAVLDLPAAAG